MAPPDLGRLGDPPGDFASLALPLRQWQVPLFRIHRKTHAALYFGVTGTNRFDDPARRFGVVYASASFRGAFAETVVATGVRSITAQALADRVYSQLVPVRALRLVDLTGPGLLQIGSDARLASGDYHVAQRWSRALYTHPSVVDGLCYPARRDPSCTSVALFDRAADALDPSGAVGLLSRAAARIVGDALDTYDLALID